MQNVETTFSGSLQRQKEKLPFNTEIVKMNEWTNKLLNKKLISTLLVWSIKPLRSQVPYLCVLYTYTQGILVNTWKRNWWHPEANLFLLAKDSATSQLWCSDLHSAASAKWQQSPSTGKYLMPRKYSSYFINSFEQTCLSFSTYLLVLHNPLLCNLYELYSLKGLRYFNPYFPNSLSEIWKKLQCCLSSYILLFNCRITYCNLENIMIKDSFSNVPSQVTPLTGIKQAPRSCSDPESAHQLAWGPDSHLYYNIVSFHKLCMRQVFWYSITCLRETTLHKTSNDLTADWI